MKRHNLFYFFIILGSFIGFILKLFIIDAVHISGVSMEPCLHNNSIVFVNKIAYGIVKPFSGEFLIQWGTPKENDIIIFLHNNKIVVKRCAALSLEQLDFFTEPQYILSIKGKSIPLTYDQYCRMKDFKHIPEGYVMALGDNLKESIDSRNYGFVSVKNIIGKIIGK